jgi:hypothetical protein
MVLDGVSLSALAGFPSSGVDKILLVLFVAVVGSLLLPAFRLARVVGRGQTRIRLEAETDNRLQVQREGRETIGEIKEQIDYDPARRFVFRPLTEEQKKEFEDWSVKYKQRMPERAVKAESSVDAAVRTNLFSPPTALRNPPSLARGSPAWPSAWTATARATRATGNPASRQLARRGQPLKN